MRAKLQSFLPSSQQESTPIPIVKIDNRLEKQLKEISDSICQEEFVEWAKEIEEELTKAASEGKTSWEVTTLPYLAHVCYEAKQALEQLPEDTHTIASIALSAEIGLYCLRHAILWRDFSNVTIEPDVRTADIWRTNGDLGLLFHFDWSK